jgi:hypothetical protein
MISQAAYNVAVQLDPFLLFCAVVCLVLAPVAIVMIFAGGKKKRPPPEPMVIYDSGSSVSAPAAWSATRGFYTFRVADLPLEYQGLEGIAGNDAVTQLAENLEDARRQLLQLCLDKTLKATSTLPELSPAITAEHVRFRPLNMRKGERRAR